MTTTYVGKDVIRMQRAEWTRLSQDKSYWCVREFDNGEVYVCAKWRGKVDGAENYFPSMYPTFMLVVGNYDAGGNLREDPGERQDLRHAGGSFDGCRPRRRHGRGRPQRVRAGRQDWRQHEPRQIHAVQDRAARRRITQCSSGSLSGERVKESWIAQ